MSDRVRDENSGPEHVAIWVSGDGWNLNCSCGWKSEKFGYYQRGRALGQYDAHVES